MASFMRGSDAFSWYLERDPALRATVVAVAWLERSPDWDVLVSRLDRATRRAPGFRQRVVEPPGRLSTPCWVDDDHFDLTWHLRRVDAPSPHTDAAVVALARGEATTGFDRSRPLWVFTLVEGLDNGRAALVMKLHHSLTDGIGGMDMAALLFDVDPDAGDGSASDGQDGDAPRWSHPLGAAQVATSALARDARSVGHLLTRDALGMVQAAMRAGTHPRRSIGEAWQTMRSIARTVAPVSTTLSPLMARRGTLRTLDLIETELEDLKRAAGAAEGTVNDAFLAAVTGGLRRYHEAKGAAVDALRLTLPISIRKADDPMGGNRITLMRFTVPVGETSPAKRITAIDRLCRAARRERSIAFTEHIASVLNLLPSGVVGGLLKHVDFLASDVPGISVPLYLAGARIERLVSFGPTLGAALNLTLISYAGRCSIAVTVDGEAVPDHELLIESLRQGFEEVLELGGTHEPVHRPLLAAAA
ncbi:MAG: wax ester/triacylglycerol synthase domain-containing protein [Acidimicrobiales bacterium]